ncbi:MAG TPA: methyltransferase [Phycisphaerae bacterium]|nr:methyltransferase [Phycisphaerae bacterium]
MTLPQVPTLILGLTVTAYWMYVGRMVRRVRQNAGNVKKVLVPAQRREKLMWIVWVPLILLWFTTPLKVALGYGGRYDEIVISPFWAASNAVLVVRFIAAVIALGCLGLSIVTWRHMGEQWRMGIDPTQKIRLLVDGPFARIRHPIYSLSILLMLCSVVILPSPTMFVLAAVHILLMHIKAGNEERFLLETQGRTYAEYCRKTGRFVPFIRHSGPAHVPHMDGSETSPDSPIRAWKAGGIYPFRLNMFQQAMLHWDRLHPYNAVHAVRVNGPANVEKLRHAAWEVAKNAGLGEFAVNALHTKYEYRPLQHVRVQEFAPGRSDEQRLDELVAEELNTPFHGEMHHPVRWTVFNESAGEGHYVILCYHHVIADAYGIERIFAAVLHRYLNVSGAGDERPLTTRLTRLDRSLRPKAGILDYVIGQIRLNNRHRQMRRAHKMPDERLGGDATAVAIRTAPDRLLERLSAGCKRRGVGVNDALIAALASTIAEQTPDRHTSRRRRHLTMATVVGARKHLPAEQADDFGVCLTSIVAVLRKPDVSMDELVRDVARQTRVLKERPSRASAETTLRYFAVRWMWRLAALKHERRGYRRVFPICGAVSSVYVDDKRFAELALQVARYVRACPCGPAFPLILAPTMLRGSLELGLTYRISCRTRPQAEALLDGIVSRLESLADLEAASGPAPELVPSETSAQRISAAIVEH